MTLNDLDDIPAVGFDLSSQEFLRDPHPYYRRIREDTPVASMPGDFVLLSRYEDCFKVLRAPEWEMPPTFGCIQTTGNGDEDPNFRGMRGLVGAGPDTDADQRHARTVLTRAFSKQGTMRLESLLAGTANRLLDKAIEAGEVDLVEAFTAPLVYAITCDLLGIPAEDHPAVREWISDLAGLIDPTFLQSPEEAERQTLAGRKLREYMTALVAEHRGRPGDDLLSDLMATSESGRQLSDDELVTTSCILVVGATNPTMNFLGTAIWSLLQNSGQLAILRDDPSIAQMAVEELLRYAPPAQFSIRVAPEDTELGGYRIRKGRQVVALVASANRDPAVFEDPERLDLTRDYTPHLTFGHGRYHCVGAMFARAEARYALTTLVGRAPGLTPVGLPDFKQRFTMRGPVRLPVSFRARAAG